MSLTEKQKQKYLKARGDHCPFCEMPDPHCFEPWETNFEMDKSKVGRKMECLFCSEVWWEIYFARMYGVRADDEIR